MYIQKISLEKALELESVGTINIVSTHEDSNLSHEREQAWRDSFADLRLKAPTVPLPAIFHHYPTPYLIEQEIIDQPNPNIFHWKFFRGISNPDSSLISSDNIEYVYVLVNADYPDLVKIGVTVKSPDKRLESINSTGVVTHWDLAFALPLIPGSGYRVESQVHNFFVSRRYHAKNLNDKEMFYVPLSEAIDEIRRIGQYFTAGMPKFYN
jgi:hypothetical protein